MWLRKAKFLCLATSLFFLLLGTKTYGQDTLLVSGQFNQSNVKKALKKVSRQYSLKFAYDPAAMEQIRIDTSFDSCPVKLFLSSILRTSDYTFKLLDGTWLILPRSPKTIPINPTRTNFTLTGIVRDATSGESLPFATISAGTQNSTLANEDGRFTLFNIPTDTSTIRATYIGYYTSTLKLTPKKSSGSVILQLKLKNQLLPIIEVPGNNSIDFLRLEKQNGHYTLNPKKFDEVAGKGEQDVFQTLSLLPGVEGSTEVSPGLQIRGAKSDETLVLFDGFTVYHVDHFFGAFSAFNSAAIKNVQLLKGAYDAKYGGRTGGIVNITGIDGNKNYPKLTLGSNLFSGQMALELPIVPGNASLLIAGRRSFTDQFHSGAYKTLFNNIYNGSVLNGTDQNVNSFSDGNSPFFFYYDSNVKFSFAPTPKDAISLSFYKGRDQMRISFKENSSNLVYKSDDNSNWGNTGGSVKWSRQWTKHFYSKINAGASLYETDLSALESYSYPNSLLNLTRSLSQNTSITDFTLRYNNSLDENPSNKTEFGLDFSNIRISSYSLDQIALLTDSSQNSKSTAFYLQHTYTPNPLLTLKAGLRANYYSESPKPLIEPRFSLDYKLSEFYTFSASAGIFNQTLRRLNEQNLYLDTPESWVLSDNNTIPVLNSRELDVGLQWARGAFGASLETYSKRETGTIDFLYPEFFLTSADLGNYALNGIRNTSGFDFLFQFRKGHHTGWLSYSLLNSQQKYSNYNANNWFPSYSSITNEIKLVYLFEWKNWSASGTYVLATGRPYTPVLGTYSLQIDNLSGQFLALGDPNSQRLPYYDRLDLSVTYTYSWKKQRELKVGINIYNVYNEHNIKYLKYYLSPTNVPDFYDIKLRKIYGLRILPTIFVKAVF